MKRSGFLKAMATAIAVNVAVRLDVPKVGPSDPYDYIRTRIEKGIRLTLEKYQGAFGKVPRTAMIQRDIEDTVSRVLDDLDSDWNPNIVVNGMEI